MSEQELRDIWNNSSRSERISIEASQLVKELNGRVSRLQKVIRKRDIREISASVLGILIFTYFLVEIPFPITKIACGLSIAWFVYVIYRFQKSKAGNKETDLALSLAEQLQEQSTMMTQQVKLLRTVSYWYALPPLVTNVLFVLGLGNPTDYDWINGIAEWILPMSVPMKLGTILFLAAFYVFIAWINYRASKKDIEPILENIQSVREELAREG